MSILLYGKDGPITMFGSRCASDQEPDKVFSCPKLPRIEEYISGPLLSYYRLMSTLWMS